MNQLNCVFLDSGSTDNDDLDFSNIQSLCQWTTYDYTQERQTAERIATADIVISNKVYLGKTELQKAENLKLICVAATGTNNVDLDYTNKKNIPVANVRAYATPSVTQHVFSLMLMLHTHMHDFAGAVKQGAWNKAKHFCLLDYPITELQGKTIGIIGYGELGKSVASVATAFGMKVIIAESTVHPNMNGRVPLEELFSTADVISLHCPLTEDTKEIINKNTLSLMKSSAILINTARGGLVNETDLLVALQNNGIAGAGLDVISKEPPVNNVLLNANLGNLIVTPHTAWASRESRQRLVNEIALNIDAFLKGEKRNIVHL